MKILHVYIDFDPFGGGGGVARHIYGLSNALVKLGFQVRVVAQDTLPCEGIISVYRAKWNDLVKHVKWADVVHIHGARKPYCAFAGGLAKFFGIRVIYTPHCYYQESVFSLKQFFKFVWNMTAERILLRWCDGTILLTESWREYLDSQLLPTSRVHIIPNCVTESDVMSASNVSQKLSGNPSVLSVGRLDPVKRLDDVMAAMAACNTMSKAVFHIVGKGPDRERLEAEADHYGVKSRVIFHGFVPDADVAGMAKASDIFVLPSAAEGLPTVLIEMLLWGTPIACSRIPGNLAITDKVGLDCSFEVGNIEELCTTVVRMAGTMISEDVHTSVVDNFTWERIAQKIAALYRGDRPADA